MQNKGLFWRWGELNCLHSLTSCSLIPTACVRCRRHPCRLFLPLVGAHSGEFNFFLNKNPLLYKCFFCKARVSLWRWGELNSRPSRLSRCLYRFIEARYLSGDGSGFKGVVSLLRMADCSASRAEPAHSARQVPICDRILHR